jgi:hypothetical protein
MADNKFEAPEIESPNLLNQKSEWMESFNFGDYKSPAETIEEMKKELEKSNQAISDVKAELQKERDSHRHDTLKQILITLLGCTVSFLLGYFLH